MTAARHGPALLLMLALATSLPATPRSRHFEVHAHSEGYRFPAWALWDPSEERFLVVERNGYPMGRGQRGAVTPADLRGRPLALSYVPPEGGPVLDAPSAAALRGPILFVADGSRLRRFSADAGTPLGDVDLAPEGARVLTSLLLDPGDQTLLAGDRRAGKVLRHDPTTGGTRVLAEGLGRVHGLAWHEGDLVALAFAPRRRSSVLWRLPEDGPPEELFATEEARFVSLAPFGGDLALADREGGRVQLLRPDPWRLTDPVEDLHRPLGAFPGPEDSLLVLEETGSLYVLRPLPEERRPPPPGKDAPASLAPPPAVPEPMPAGAAPVTGPLRIEPPGPGAPPQR